MAEWNWFCILPFGATLFKEYYSFEFVNNNMILLFSFFFILSLYKWKFKIIVLNHFSV